MTIDPELLAAVPGDGGRVPAMIFARFSPLDGSVSAPGTAEGSAGDAFKAGSASPCSWWLCWPVTRGTEAAASLALVLPTEPAGLPNSNCDQLSFVLFSLFSPLCLRLSFVSGSAGSW